MVNKGKLERRSLLWDTGVKACASGGLFALGRRTSRVKMVPRRAGPVTELQGEGAAG